MTISGSAPGAGYSGVNSEGAVNTAPWGRGGAGVVSCDHPWGIENVAPSGGGGGVVPERYIKLYNAEFVL